MKEFVGRFSGGGRAGGAKTAKVSDAQRILRKFGEPAERLGIGKKVRTEHGIRYDRKWNYYYRTTGAKGPVMRTVYFVDGAFSGSAVCRPDGTWTREKVKFSY